MDDHSKSGSDVENEKPRSSSSVSSGSPREVALFPAAVDQHAAAAAPYLRHRALENLDEDVEGRSDVVPGGAADDDDSPADSPRPGRNATLLLPWYDRPR